MNTMKIKKLASSPHEVVVKRYSEKNPTKTPYLNHLYH